MSLSFSSTDQYSKNSTDNKLEKERKHKDIDFKEPDPVSRISFLPVVAVLFALAAAVHWVQTGRLLLSYFQVSVAVFSRFLTFLCAIEKENIVFYF